jgi:hypothetical protein
MALRLARNTRPPSHKLRWFLILGFPFAISLSGCNETCITITSNPPNGNINIQAGDPKPSCTLTVAKAAVSVITRTVSTCSSCAPANQVRQIVLNLRGIELHPGAIADNSSPDWQEVLPGTSPRALQFDLGSGPSSPGALDSHQAIAPAVAIPAATYHQLRLRFSPNVAAAGDVLPKKHACGDAGPNCVVMGDGRVLPILLDSAEPELRLTLPSGLLFPPDSSSNLVIEFGLSWLLADPDGVGSRLLPAINASASIERAPASQIAAE